MNKNDKLNICFFSGDISKSGGTERVSTIIANGLINRGYNICFLSMNNGKESYYELDSDIKLYTLLEKKYTNFFSRKILPYLKLIKFIKKYKIDLIIDIDIILSLYTIPSKIFCGIKNISWEHFNFKDNRIKNRKRARKLAARFSDCIVTLNKTDYNNYISGIKKIRRIEYIYNPAIVKRKATTKLENKNVISIGRLNEQKGFDILLNIWKSVEEKNIGWKLQIIGSGSQEEKLKEIIRKLNLQRVEIIPFQKDIERFYEEASIYTLTSRIEGFPMVLLEAQKKGLPIIAFDCPTGPSEIVINDRNGYLIENKNEYQFSRALLTLMNDKELLKKFSRNAKLDSERYDINRIIDKWVNLLSEI